MKETWIHIRIYGNHGEGELKIPFETELYPIIDKFLLVMKNEIKQEREKKEVKK